MKRGKKSKSHFRNISIINPKHNKGSNPRKKGKEKEGYYHPGSAAGIFQARGKAGPKKIQVSGSQPFFDCGPLIAISYIL